MRAMQVPFDYNKDYFETLYSSRSYRWFIKRRNSFIHKEVTKIISKGNFLDIGFGDDALVKLFVKDFNVYGIDISKYAVKFAQKKYNASHFQVCDISDEDIPFDEKFDVVCGQNLIEHLQNPRQALKRIFDVLDPGGIFVVQLPTQSNIFSKLQYKLFYDACEHIYRPSNRNLRQLFTDTGFKLHKEYAGTFIPFGIKISSRLLLSCLNLYCGIWRK